MRPGRRALRCVRQYHYCFASGVSANARSLRDWWAYFGSFGDDIFGDEDTDEA